jgi:predicted transglutaminase-like cysteine proteinase
MPKRLQSALAALAVGAILAAASAAIAFETPGGMRLFGYGERPNIGLAEFPKWTRVLQRYGLEQALEQAPCGDGSCAPQRWRAHLDGLSGRSPSEQLRSVNAYINRTRFVADSINYGVADYWATPREFFARGGDCEDFAIAKFLSLRRLGWNMELVRVVVAMDERRRELHAVLAVKTEGTVMILDNLLPEPTDHRRITHYRPIYSINEFAWWFHHRVGAPSVVSAADRSLLARASCKTATEFSAALRRFDEYAEVGPY